ncbi:hypothetical protein FLAVO9AF_390020 [Flavobacterium sp. 9AF]|uniref:hypothetical protein n=1 Tax=Flavobacterium sp. 9AF TaxID=2653142 RepID=UPI0012F37B7E|nr:hypothetical protein [Flavobacterium sp. 9AF]VXB95907.1 hypothetical protein FLAVO9AF_390020 [Flavobacterium sp. 9AF]
MNSHFSGLHNRDRIIANKKKARKEKLETRKNTLVDTNENVMDNNIPYPSLTEEQFQVFKTKIKQRNKQQAFAFGLIFLIIILLLFAIAIKYKVI